MQFHFLFDVRNMQPPFFFFKSFISQTQQHPRYDLMNHGTVLVLFHIISHSKSLYVPWGRPQWLICLVVRYSTVFCRAACLYCGPMEHKDRKAGLVTSVIH